MLRKTGRSQPELDEAIKVSLKKIKFLNLNENFRPWNLLGNV